MQSCATIVVIARSVVDLGVTIALSIADFARNVEEVKNASGVKILSLVAAVQSAQEKKLRVEFMNKA
jgi:hypothetical protein